MARLMKLSVFYLALVLLDLNVTTRLLEKSLHSQQNIEEESDAFEYDEYDEYYTNYADDDILNAYEEDIDLPIHFEERSQTNDDLQSYLETPGYTVKMNEIVFMRYVSVLVDLYGMNDDQKFGDGKAAIEELRQALKDEARYFFEQPLRSIGALIVDKWNTYKWDIAKVILHSVPIPVIGYTLKLSLVVLQYEPAVRRFVKNTIQQRKIRSKYHELDEALHVDKGEPFALYVLKHWKPSDQDAESIHNINLKCPLKPKKVIVQQGEFVPTNALLRESPGKCVWLRIDHKVVEKKMNLLFRPVKKCIDSDYDECKRLRDIANIDCHWQYCRCIPYSLFVDVMSCDTQFCAEKKESECLLSAGCEWA